MAKNKIRVRYAPSPTGHLHIGNARTALFNYLFARHNKGTFVLRIEDTDTKRNIADGEKSQMDNLEWLGIDWDEGPDKPGKYGPYRQSERKDIYKPLIQELLDKDLAYESFMTEEELQAQREEQKARGEAPRYVYEYEGMSKEEIKKAQDEARAKGLKPVVRIRVPHNKTYEWDDIVKGKISFLSDTIGGDFVIQKRDGMPTYNFAVVVDDHLMEITHVLRGDDHVANTPKQLVVYEAFGWKAPEFGHMSLIINTETGKKLSKRDETVLQFIEQYRELGYLPDAMFNFITLLGWSPVGESEIFNKQEFIKMFDAKRLSKSPAAFDGKKLEWINNQYMKKMDLNRLTEMCVPFLQKAGRIKEDLSAEDLAWVKQLVALYQPQMSYAAQIVEVSELFFIEHPVLDEAAKEVLAGETVPTVLAAFKAQLEAMEEVTSDNVRAAIKAVQKETGVKGKNLFMPIRVAVSGQMHGPELPDTVALLGKEKALNHLNQVL